MALYYDGMSPYGVYSNKRSKLLSRLEDFTAHSFIKSNEIDDSHDSIQQFIIATKNLLHHQDIKSTQSKRKRESRETRKKQRKQKKEKKVADADTWAQCDRCKKWRKLGTIDSRNLPEVWYCSMNKRDPERSFCESPEEQWETSEPSSDDIVIQESPKAEYIDVDDLQVDDDDDEIETEEEREIRGSRDMSITQQLKLRCNPMMLPEPRLSQEWKKIDAMWNPAWFDISEGLFSRVCINKRMM